MTDSCTKLRAHANIIFLPATVPSQLEHWVDILKQTDYVAAVGQELAVAVAVADLVWLCEEGPL